MSEGPIRLQKILARAGCGSRRACEVFISDGRVTVDGVVVTELGVRADPEIQEVRFDGEKVAGPGRLPAEVARRRDLVYCLLNKPAGVLCTTMDPAGRPVVGDLAPQYAHLHTVGRLDMDSGGLLLLTNDGDLTNLLTHPRYGVPKTYRARVDGEVRWDQVETLRRGVHLAEGKVRPREVIIVKRGRSGSELEITVGEGLNREVRRILAKVDLHCRALKRISMGSLALGDLEEGRHRLLTTQEVEELRKSALRASSSESERSGDEEISEKNYRRNEEDQGRGENRRDERGGGGERRPFKKFDGRERTPRKDGAGGGFDRGARAEKPGAERAERRPYQRAYDGERGRGGNRRDERGGGGERRPFKKFDGRTRSPRADQFKKPKENERDL
jgi:23S rRNA pseudouridine2605 synthase